MKKLKLLPFVLILIACFVSYGNNPVPAGKDKSGKTKTVLFNGKDLNGWYTFLKGKGRNNDPNKVFTVQNGLIRISGEEFGCITTTGTFENYTLLAEFRWGALTYPPRKDKARDSGILLHSKGEDGGYSGIWMHSIECQIIEGGTGDMLVVGDGSADFSLTCPVEAEKQAGSFVFSPGGNQVTITSGRINWWGRDPGWQDVKGFRGSKDVEKPTGNWNKIECRVSGKEITIFLNGKMVNHATDVHPRSGKIQIQSEGAEIFFRKIILLQGKETSQ